MSIMVAHFIIRKDLCLACKIFPAATKAPSRKIIHSSVSENFGAPCLPLLRNSQTKLKR